MSDKEMNDLLRGMRDEPVPADSVRRVRARVAERTRSRARAWWWIPAMAAALCTLLVALWLNDAPAEQSNPVAQAPTATPEPKPQAEPPLRVASRPPKPKPVRAVAKKDDEILIRIETPDPDVVILLVGD